MIDGVIIICIVQLTIVQEARLGAVSAKVAMPIVDVAEAHCAAVVWSWAHIRVVPLAMTEDIVVPLRAFLVDMISAVLLALTAIKPPLTLAVAGI
jgi:hypothetical protein